MFSNVFTLFQIKKIIKSLELIKVPLDKDNDGNQDLDMCMRDPLDVLQELLSDTKASGKQYFTYQEYRNERGEREFFHTNGTLWWQRAQEHAISTAGPQTGVVSIIMAVDATYVKKNTYF